MSRADAFVIDVERTVTRADDAFSPPTNDSVGRVRDGTCNSTLSPRLALLPPTSLPPYPLGLLPSPLSADVFAVATYVEGAATSPDVSGLLRAEQKKKRWQEWVRGRSRAMESDHFSRWIPRNAGVGVVFENGRGLDSRGGATSTSTLYHCP